MDITKIDVKEVLPQRPPFLLVGKMLSYDEGNMVTQYCVTGNEPLYEDGSLRAEGLVENMAQSCAARVGYISKYILHQPLKIGYIGSVKGFKCFARPVAGDVLETTVNLVSEFAGITLCDVTIRRGDEVIATTSMKTALRD